jgi:hypothetical protein
MKYIKMTPDMIVIHHSAGEDRKGLDWDGIRKYHMTPPDQGGPKDGPYIDIAYHAGVELVDQGYEILMGRPWDKRGAHCIGANSRALGLCFIGDFNKAAPTLSQLRTGARDVALWMRIWTIPLGRIYRHDTLNATDCPGSLFDLTKFLNLIQEEL